MIMDSYQRVARKTVIYPRKQKIIYPALGLAGEAGEVCEKVKKYLRQDYDLDELKEKVEDELGDVLWYIANLATDLGLSLDNLAAKNLAKLHDRQNRNVIKGDGDDR
jgi:NTP pyrophosphatase (non-canonical NTP hydrolase)